MKASGKGIAVIILFLIGIPVFVDLIVSLLIKENKNTGQLSKILLKEYLFFLPRYIWYVILALTIMYLLKQTKTYSKNKE